MRTIEIHADDELIRALESRAHADSRTLEQVAKEALAQYVGAVARKPGYSFIGIGHSGTGDLSTRVEETLAEGADRRGGWSLEE